VYKSLESSRFSLYTRFLCTRLKFSRGGRIPPEFCSKFNSLYASGGTATSKARVRRDARQNGKCLVRFLDAVPFRMHRRGPIRSANNDLARPLDEAASPYRDVYARRATTASREKCYRFRGVCIAA